MGVGRSKRHGDANRATVRLPDAQRAGHDLVQFRARQAEDHRIRPRVPGSRIAVRVPHIDRGIRIRRRRGRLQRDDARPRVDLRRAARIDRHPVGRDRDAGVVRGSNRLVRGQAERRGARIVRLIRIPGRQRDDIIVRGARIARSNVLTDRNPAVGRREPDESVIGGEARAGRAHGNRVTLEEHQIAGARDRGNQSPNTRIQRLIPRIDADAGGRGQGQGPARSDVRRRVLDQFQNRAGRGLQSHRAAVRVDARDRHVVRLDDVNAAAAVVGRGGQIAGQRNIDGIGPGPPDRGTIRVGGQAQVAAGNGRRPVVAIHDVGAGDKGDIAVCTGAAASAGRSALRGQSAIQRQIAARGRQINRARGATVRILRPVHSIRGPAGRRNTRDRDRSRTCRHRYVSADATHLASVIVRGVIPRAAARVDQTIHLDRARIRYQRHRPTRIPRRIRLRLRPAQRIHRIKRQSTRRRDPHAAARRIIRTRRRDREGGRVKNAKIPVVCIETRSRKRRVHVHRPCGVDRHRSQLSSAAHRAVEVDIPRPRRQAQRLRERGRRIQRIVEHDIPRDGRAGRDHDIRGERRWRIERHGATGGGNIRGKGRRFRPGNNTQVPSAQVQRIRLERERVRVGPAINDDVRVVIGVQALDINGIISGTGIDPQARGRIIEGDRFPQGRDDLTHAVPRTRVIRERNRFRTAIERKDAVRGRAAIRNSGLQVIQPSVTDGTAVDVDAAVARVRERVGHRGRALGSDLHTVTGALPLSIERYAARQDRSTTAIIYFQDIVRVILAINGQARAPVAARPDDRFPLEKLIGISRPLKGKSIRGVVVGGIDSVCAALNRDRDVVAGSAEITDGGAEAAYAKVAVYLVAVGVAAKGAGDGVRIIIINDSEEIPFAGDEVVSHRERYPRSVCGDGHRAGDVELIILGFRRGPGDVE